MDVFLRTFLRLLFAALSMCVAADASADSLTDWVAHRDQQQQTYEAQISQDKLLPTSGLSDVVQIHVDEKRALTLETRLQTTPSRQENCIVRLQKPEQFAIVHIVGGSDGIDHPPVVPMSFTFSTTDYSNPRETCTLNVNAQTSAFTISRSVVSPAAYRWVQLMEEQSSDESGAPGMVQLVVNESWDSQGTMPLTLQAEDFWTLLRKFPRESDLYIRPLLRDLGQEAVCAPDPLVAWQVFSDRWHPNREAQLGVSALLPALDDPTYRVRNQAVQSLVNLGREGAAVMVHLDRTRLSAEQNAQIDRALAPFSQLAPSEALRLRSSPAFLMDCLYGEDSTLREAAAQRLEELLGPSGRIDPQAEARQRVAAVAELRRTFPGP